MHPLSHVAGQRVSVLAACLFVAGFIVFIQKISTVTTGTQQALICAGLAGLIVALFTISQYLLGYAFLL